jgi:hypothetical protein
MKTKKIGTIHLRWSKKEHSMDNAIECGGRDFVGHEIFNHCPVEFTIKTAIKTLRSLHTTVIADDE